MECRGQELLGYAHNNLLKKNIKVGAQRNKMTIAELRDFLLKEEAKWTKLDVELLGPFDQQKILVPHYTFGEVAQFKGYDDNNSIWMDETGMGYCIDINE